MAVNFARFGAGDIASANALVAALAVLSFRIFPLVFRLTGRGAARG